jgi:hypothetical protein
MVSHSLFEVLFVSIEKPSSHKHVAENGNKILIANPKSQGIYFSFTENQNLCNESLQISIWRFSLPSDPLRTPCVLVFLCVHLSIHLIQCKNCWSDLDEVWYGLHAIGNTLRNANMADGLSCNVVSTATCGGRLHRRITMGWQTIHCCSSAGSNNGMKEPQQLEPTAEQQRDLISYWSKNDLSPCWQTLHRNGSGSNLYKNGRTQRWSCIKLAKNEQDSTMNRDHVNATAACVRVSVWSRARTGGRIWTKFGMTFKPLESSLIGV